MRDCSTHRRQGYHSIAVFMETSLANFLENAGNAKFAEWCLCEVQGMRFIRTSCEFRRTIAPFRALPLAFVATIPDVAQASVRQCMPVVCQCRRIRTSPCPYGMRKNRLLMRVIVPLWTRLDARFLTRNEQVSGSSPLVGSH